MNFTLWPDSQWLRRFKRAILFWAAATLFAGLVYSRLDVTRFFKVIYIAGLWNLNLTILALCVLWLTLKVPFEGVSKFVFWGIHLVAGIVFGVLSTLMAFGSLYIHFDAGVWQYLDNTYYQYFHISVITYIAVACWFYFLQYLRKWKEQGIREARLKELSREATLKALKNQINPHFLFNALNSINALVTIDPEKAREMIASLAEILRYVLHSSETDFVSLKQEMDFIETYLAIEKSRFREKLQLEISVDANLGDILVPPVIFQPLVENAVKHGIEKLPRGGQIRIEVTTHKKHLLFRVLDNGPGIDMDRAVPTSNGGIGSKNVRERLTAFYGEDFTFTITSNTPSGCISAISIPATRTGSRP
ncbi:MAG: hypothetical protein GY765_14875 [bacterium]|nr:hypothetical protein [bacterium]